MRRANADNMGKPKTIAEKPSSALSNTATVQEELEAVNATGFDLVNLNEIEMRIGLLSRIILEHTLRLQPHEMQLSGITLKDKVDLSLRAITTLEGQKSEVTWKESLAKKPQRVTLEQYKKEREEAEETLKKILKRKKEVKLASAELALAQLKSPTKGKVN